MERCSFSLFVFFLRYKEALQPKSYQWTGSAVHASPITFVMRCIIVCGSFSILRDMRDHTSCETNCFPHASHLGSLLFHETLETYFPAILRQIRGSKRMASVWSLDKRIIAPFGTGQLPTDPRWKEMLAEISIKSGNILCFSRCKLFLKILFSY